MCKLFKSTVIVLLLFGAISVAAQQSKKKSLMQSRERVLINNGWKFFKYDTNEKSDDLIYDVRPEAVDEDGKAADAKPTEAVKLNADRDVLKPWILPSGNDFIKDPSKRYKRPIGNPGADFPFVKTEFDDSKWESVTLPHDWAIKGPFYKGNGVPVGGGMGRLPIQGVAWYRKQVNIASSESNKKIYLEIDGAMSYAMVWLNGKLVGGWPYGYASFRLDLTPYVNFGGDNQIAIRIDNPLSSSRWYPGAGLYRNVWLVKTNKVSVGQWGVTVTTPTVNAKEAVVAVMTKVNNEGSNTANVTIKTEIYVSDEFGKPTGKVIATALSNKQLKAMAADSLQESFIIKNPKLWGPWATQKPNRYVAVTKIIEKGVEVDHYQTVFGIRDIRFDAEKGLLVNGEKITIKGVNQHHDLGALGAAFNERAAERQLEMLKEVGCNAIRLAHNPPAPELLDLLDRMGFLVIDEIFDVWERKKTPLDFHLIFPEWHEQDVRAFIRRDRNHPCVISWSFGNEVGEQYTDIQGAAVAQRLHNIIKQEDNSRPTTVSMNYAKPNMPLPAVVDVINLNYQGEGIRNSGGYAGLKGISTPPLFPAFKAKFPDKVILSSENAAAVSSRGEYLFPVYEGNSAPIRDNLGGNPETQQVSSYELYTADFGSSADKVFSTMDQHPFVVGGFVWSGWDYLGEPTPYYLSKGSYFGLIDLAGFKKDRFYLYQSYWLPEKPMAHILPHWNWKNRQGQITPVHVFTSGDEAELFLNGKSLGRKRKGQYEYRIRWDDVTFSPGELKVVAYKKGKKWAEDTVKTTGVAASIKLSADRTVIKANGEDLSFVTVAITDKDGNIVPNAKNRVAFTIEGAGEIVATDNGDAANLESFSLHERDAFNGLCLVIIKAKPGETGNIILKSSGQNLQPSTITLQTK